MVNLGWLGLELLLAAAGAEVEAPVLLLRHMAGSGPIHLHAADRVAHHVPGAGLFRVGAMAVARVAGVVMRLWLGCHNRRIPEFGGTHADCASDVGFPVPCSARVNMILAFIFILA